MFERFTDSARHLLVKAQHEARRLGHNYIGCEHLLLAAAGLAEPAGAALRDQGVTTRLAAATRCTAWTARHWPRSGSTWM